MSRKLKFRVWDKLAQCYTYPESAHQSHHVLSLNGEYLNYQNGVGGTEVVIEQFTGLYDKTGKEIYEGDIISGKEKLYSDFEHYRIHKKMVVIFKECGFYYSLDHRRNYINPHAILSSAQEREVIGNINENTELLENNVTILKDSVKS